MWRSSALRLVVIIWACGDPTFDGEVMIIIWAHGNNYCGIYLIPDSALRSSAQTREIVCVGI